MERTDDDASDRVDETVDLTDLRLDPVDDLAERGGIEHVGRERDGAGRRGGRIEPVAVTRDDRDLAARGGEAGGDRGTDSARPADDCNACIFSP
jgi:hypothetical protein